MKTIILLKGLPASGKSTFARETIKSKPGEFVRVNKDDLRSMLHNGRWSKHNEKQIIRMRDAIVVDSLKDGKSVIVDDTNLHPRHEARMKQLAKENGAVVHIYDVFLEVPLEDCIKWDLKRANSVGEKVIRGMHKQFLSETKTNSPLNPTLYDAALPFCVIFDLDGTLAHITDRSPYDGKACASDIVNQSIRQLYWHIQNSKLGIKMIIFSGRNGESEPETRKWLENNDIKFDELHMRKPEDKRKDSEVKKEMLDNFVVGKYNVDFIVDDRDQVVKMWRDNGLTCIQVNEGDF